MGVFCSLRASMMRVGDFSKNNEFPRIMNFQEYKTPFVGILLTNSIFGNDLKTAYFQENFEWSNNTLYLGYRPWENAVL